ncbi:hypothetical protein Q5752_006937 [Cryptotrichosporon argae]
MSGPTLLVLVPHLRFKLSAVVDLPSLPADLTSSIRAALTQPDLAAPPIPTSSAGGPSSSLEAQTPPAVLEETIVGLARWAASAGRPALEQHGLDLDDYSHIALGAGTAVYLPAKQARIVAGLDATPFLPAHLLPSSTTNTTSHTSSSPPSSSSSSSSSPLRSLARQLSTALNILFSILGSAFAAHHAARASGFAPAACVLLAVAAGAVVGVADAVGVWIYVGRLERDRAAARERGRMEARGSAAETHEIEDEAGGDHEMAQHTGTTATEKREVRLRRRAIGDT